MKLNKIIIFINLMLFCCLSVTAQEKKHFSPQEFQAKQQAFITEKASLTKEEAARFFPLYNELQSRKRDLNNQNRKLYKQGRDSKTTESQYKKIVEQTIDNRVEAEKLEQVYLKQYQKFLSSKKIFAIQVAEFKFNREILKKLSEIRSKPKANQ